MKKFFVFVVTCVIIASMSFGAFAQECNSVVFNGEEVEFYDAFPKVEDEQVLIPLRAVYEKIGANVFWEEKTQTVIVSSDDVKMVSQIGNNTIFLGDGVSFELVKAPFIENDRTYIVADTLNKVFGFEVNFDEENKILTVTSK